MANRNFGAKAQELAAQVQAGDITQAAAEQELGLEPGQRLAPTGVIMGSAQYPDIPRHGADETDNDHLPSNGSGPLWDSLYAAADLLDFANRDR